MIAQAVLAPVLEQLQVPQIHWRWDQPHHQLVHLGHDLCRQLLVSTNQLNWIWFNVQKQLEKGILKTTRKMSAIHPPKIDSWKDGWRRVYRKTAKVTTNASNQITSITLFWFDVRWCPLSSDEIFMPDLFVIYVFNEEETMVFSFDEHNHKTKRERNWFFVFVLPLFYFQWTYLEMKKKKTLSE